eukprot:Partr_v1_DN27961_c1_g1_i2_m11686 putative RPEL repeat protein
MPRSASPSKTKPSPIVGKKKIEEFVAKRPNKEELLDKNILKSGAVAPGLASKQSELEKSKVKDTINSHLTARPTTDHLVEQNVLMVDPTSKTAPTGQILQAQQALKKSQVSDSLTKKLDARKSETDLLTRNILKAPTTVSGALVNAQQSLQRSQVEDTISQQIKKVAEKQGGKSPAAPKKASPKKK